MTQSEAYKVVARIAASHAKSIREWGNECGVNAFTEKDTNIRDALCALKDVLFDASYGVERFVERVKSLIEKEASK